MTGPEVVEPRAVQLTPEGILIQWGDGHTSLYPHRFLRLRCQCAGCVGEWPHRRDLDPSTVPLDVQALDYLTVGRYALQFLWSDGHYTGIYTYELLRRLCPCPACAGDRPPPEGQGPKTG